MRILITGHLGYIGGVLVPTMLDGGHEVVGLDSGLFDGCDFLSQSAVVPTVAEDIRDVEPHQLDGIDAVVHLAGISNDAVGALNPPLTDEVNHRASVSLAQAAKRAGVARFVFSSTAAVYGHRVAPVSEEVKISPLTEYSRSKGDAEAGLLAMSDDRFAVTVLRSGTVYGASPRFRLDLVMNRMVASALLSSVVEVHGGGVVSRPILDVRDLVRVFAAVVTAPLADVEGRVLNVGRPDGNLTVAEMAEIVTSLVPGARVIRSRGHSPGESSYRCDFSALRRVLPGTRLEFDPYEGARDLIEILQSRSLGVDDLDHPRYSRLGWIERRVEGGKLTADLRPARDPEMDGVWDDLLG
ncbi:MAG: NAD(P)-dependent oxidoreductase [Actinobacteria bacterium]|nr:NAD(P)-dependent oxidoreductase [Actinomycetota bacterium]